MPFINAKISKAVSAQEKEAVKAEFGKAVSIIPGKSEEWLMVGIEDNYDLYFKGNQDAPTAYVEVKLYGKASPDVFDKMTAELCRIMEAELQIPQNRVFTVYHEMDNWGWNGKNF